VITIRTKHSTQTPPDSAEYQTADTRHLHARPITSTAMEANGSERGACDGLSSSGRSGRKIRCCAPAAAGQCGSSRLSPNKALSTRYSGTSGSSTPTRRLRAIILRPSSAGRLSGEPGTPRTWPHFPARAGRSLPGRGTHLAFRVCLSARGVMISQEEPPGGSIKPDHRSSGDTRRTHMSEIASG